MKTKGKLLTVILSTLFMYFILTVNVNAAGNEVVIDSTNFPDEVFRQYVKDNFDIDGNGVLKENEISIITELSLNDTGVTSLKGIEYFINLEDLYCSRNNLSSLDISNNLKIEMLYCNGNNLSNIDISNNLKLKYINCFLISFKIPNLKILI